MSAQSLIAQAHAENGDILADYGELLASPAHWMFELTLIVLFDVMLGVIIWPRVKRVVIRRHDAKYHGKPHGDHDETP